MRARLIELGYRPIANSPADYKAYVAEQVTRIRGVVQNAGIVPN